MTPDRRTHSPLENILLANLDGAIRRSTCALVFHLPGPGPGEAYELLPFHRIAHGHYNLYWRVA